MRKRLLAAIAVLAPLGLAAGAIPAFTADSGTVSVSVTAQAPATPCLEFLTPPGTSVDFGTLPFSVPNDPSVAKGDVAPTFKNCGTANEQISIAGDDARSEGGTTWVLVPWGIFSGGCPSPVENAYELQAKLGPAIETLSKSPQLLLGLATPGTQYSFELTLLMPCEGTPGAGQTFSTTIMLTAAVE